MIGQLLTGRYLILKKLGSGGFSETYLARDKYLPLHPLCVVKCLRLSSDSTISLETAQHLFETEARVLDQLGRSHPQIPTLFAYCHEQDQVYQIQEYIEGENLGNWISQGRCISFEAAIDLLQQVLPILDFIHSHRVIHRDIKPSNLIRRQDGKIVLIDFGAACLQPETHASTEFGELEQPFAIGTPGYMPGEQEVGTSSFNSDLYALGMSVLHLLTGVHPHQFQPDPISGEIDWQTHLGSQTIDPKLADILNRMVRIRDRDRYQQASEVLSALRLHPAAKARSFPHWSGSMKPRSKWRRLQPLALALLLAGGGVGLYRQGEPAQAVMAHVHQLFQPSSQVQLTLVHDLEIKSTIKQMVISPDNRLLVTAGADHALRLWSLPDGSVFQSLLGHTDTVTALSISPDGQFLVSGSDDRTVRLWDIASGTLLHTFTEHQQEITSVAIHPNAGIVVSGDRNGTIRLWDLQTGDLRQTLQVPDASVTAVAYAESSARLISATSDRQIQVWDLKTGTLQRTFAGHRAAIVNLRVVDDQTLYSIGEDRTLVWDIDREELVQVFSKDSANPITALLDDRRLMTVHDNGSIRVWTRQAGHLLATISGQAEQYLHATLSSDHHYLVGFSNDQRLRVWRMNASVVQ